MPSLKPMIAASEAASTSVPDPLVAFALAAAVTMAIGHAASGRAATQQTKDAAALLPSAALASVWVTSDQGEDEEGEYVRDVTGWYVRDSVGAIMWRTDCRPLLSNGCCTPHTTLPVAVRTYPPPTYSACLSLHPSQRGA